MTAAMEGLTAAQRAAVLRIDFGVGDPPADRAGRVREVRHRVRAEGRLKRLLAE